MFHGSKKPYSAVTVQVDRLTSEQYEEDDFAGIYDLVEVVRIQESGPAEAARATDLLKRGRGPKCCISTATPSEWIKLLVWDCETKPTGQ